MPRRIIPQTPRRPIPPADAKPDGSTAFSGFTTDGTRTRCDRHGVGWIRYSPSN